MVMNESKPEQKKKVWSNKCKIKRIYRIVFDRFSFILFGIARREREREEGEIQVFLGPTKKKSNDGKQELKFDRESKV